MKNLKFILFSLMIGFGFVSCMDHDVTPINQADQIYAKYEYAFETTFGKPAPNQTWGFSSVASARSTRATWADNHSCNWESMLTFTVPSNAKDLTKGDFTDDERNSGVYGAVYVIPEDFSGTLNLDYKVKFNNCIIYNRGNVTNITNVNMDGVITFYNIGTMIWNITSGQRHTIINTGTFTLANDANIGTLYNGGHLDITDTDISNSVTINSLGNATISMTNGGDFKAAADIHGTLTSTKDVKIQNSNTQYICGIKITGTLDLTQGKLESSYIEADHIKFDGDQLWLLPGGHVNAGSIDIPNGCYVFGEVGSVGLIEVGNISFKNDNDFERTFSENIYFKITGSINFTGATNGNVKEKRLYTDAADYIAVNGNLNSNRLNEGTATGSPACGQPWSIGTPEVTTDPEPVFICRVFAEDLTAEVGHDFDFNDVVFDVYKLGTQAMVNVKAAGGTLPLYIDGIEVHEEIFGESTGTMINTGGGLAKDGLVAKKPIYVDNVFTSGNDLLDVRDHIKVTVQKDVLCELKATEGKAASKFAVTDSTVTWAQERQDITLKYPNFADWVKTGEPKTWWK